MISSAHGRESFDCQIIAVAFKELHHRHETSALVSLSEGVRPRDPGHQRYGQDNNVLFAKAKEIVRSGQRAFEQSLVAEEMRFAGDCDDGSINLDHCLFDSHLGSFGKGGQYFWKPRDDVAAQRLMVDLARAASTAVGATSCLASTQIC